MNEAGGMTTTTLYARAADAIRRGWDVDETTECTYCWWCNGRQKSVCLDCGMLGRVSDAKCPTNPEQHVMEADDSSDPVHDAGCPLGELLAELDAAQHVADCTRQRAILDCAGFLRVKAQCRRRIVCMGPSTLLHQEVAAELEVEADSLDNMSLTDGNDSALRLLADLVLELREEVALSPWDEALLRRAEAVLGTAAKAPAEGK